MQEPTGYETLEFVKIPGARSSYSVMNHPHNVKMDVWMFFVAKFDETLPVDSYICSPRLCYVFCWVGFGEVMGIS